MRLSLCALGLVATLTAPALAREPVNAPNGSWASELVQLAELVKPEEQTCSDHCWVLDHMRFTGALDKGRVDFILDGSLLDKGAFNIPLVGPASTVRLESVTLNGAPAVLGFEEGHYYFHTSSAHFTVRGKLVLPEDRTVTVVGPLNSLDVDVTGGRLTEGNHLSALASTVLHFDAEGDKPAEQPAVFSIARALRVGKSLDFEYRLTAQSGAPLGMLRFPLRYGERVIDVAGSVGWRIESEELVLPTQGKSAEITISGTLSNVASFAPDARAPFEWWLLESDAEHRVLAAGDAKQHDIGESPLARREPNSRLFLVQRGQHLEVTVQTLQSLDVLAATIRTHTRQVIVTASGDVVTQDLLAYDNSGIDYLYYSPDGKPVFLATDGNSERVMHKDGSEDLMVPMRLGQHTITVQTLSQASLGALFGRLTVTGPRVPLATGSEDVTVGLPATVHPMIVIGGEQSTWPVSLDDAVGGALALVASLLAFRGWKKRSLAALTLVGLWFVSKAAFACILGGGVLVMLWPLLARLSKTPRRIGMALALLATVVVGVPFLSMKSDRSLMPAAGPVAAVVVDKSEDRQAADMLPAFTQQQVMGNHNAPIGGNVADSITRAGMVDGVRPVAVSLPSYGHSAFASQQLVTPARAFTPSVYYVTDTAIALAGLLWLACAALLGWMTRSTLLAFRDRLRAALAPKPTAPITEPTPAE